MKTLCEDHPQIGESELIRNQCPRCVADLRVQVAQLTEDKESNARLAARLSGRSHKFEAQVATITEERDRWRRIADATSVEASRTLGQVATLTEALEQIAELTTPGGHGFGSKAKGIARAALAQQPEQDKQTAGTLSNAEPKKRHAEATTERCPTCESPWRERRGAIEVKRRVYESCSDPWHAEATTTLEPSVFENNTARREPK